MPTVETAATASMTLPGPTGSPAARKVRAKCIRLASNRPPPSGGSAPEICPLRPLAGGEGGDPSPSAMGRVRWVVPLAGAGDPPTSPRPSPPPGAERERSGLCDIGQCSGGLGLDLLEDARRLAALQPGDVVLVFEQHPQGVVDRVRAQFQDVELHQGFGPIDRLG